MMLRAWVVICFAAAWIGCGASTPRPSCPVPEQGRIEFVGTDRLNPDDTGRPLPTIVRLYQLSSLGDVEQASFEAMWRAPTEVLGDTLLGVEEVTVYPDRTIRRPFERNEEARFLVAVAIVRRPMGESWRSIIELPLPVSVVTCGAETEEEGGEPPPPSIPIVEVVADDYRVDASLRMVRTDDACSGPLGCAGDRAREAAGEEVGEAGEAASSQAPSSEAPSTPDAPSTDLPSVPTPN
jgi:type VI secretion system protein VasD